MNDGRELTRGSDNSRPRLSDLEMKALSLMLLYEKRLMREVRWVSHPHAITYEATTTDSGQPYVHFSTAKSLERKGLLDCLWQGEDSACELTQQGRYRAYDLEPDGGVDGEEVHPWAT